MHKMFMISFQPASQMDQDNGPTPFYLSTCTSRSRPSNVLHVEMRMCTVMQILMTWIIFLSVSRHQVQGLPTRLHVIGFEKTVLMRSVRNACF